MNSRPIVAFGTCRERWAIWEHTDSVYEAQMHLTRNGYNYGRIFEYPTYIHEGRNKIVKLFLEADAKPDYLCFVDSDNIIAYDTVYRLVQDDLPIVSALYFMRVGQPQAVAFKWTTADRTLNKSVSQEVLDLFTLNNLEINNPGEPQSLDVDFNPVLEVDVVGFGCVLIKRSVLEHMHSVYGDNLFGGHGESIGEDVIFCKRAQDLGYQINLDTSLLIGHMAKYKVSVMDFLQYGSWENEKWQQE